MIAPSSIRLRLAFDSAVLISFAGLVLGLFSDFLVRQNLESGARAFAQHEAQELGLLIARYASEEELTAHPEDFKSIYPESGVLALEVWSPANTLIFRLGAPGRPIFGPWPEGFRAAELGAVPCEELRLPSGRVGLRSALVLPERQGPRWRSLVVVERRLVDKTMRRQRLGFVLGIVITAAFVFIGSLILVQLALRPVIDMVHDARTLAEQNLGHRITVPVPGSELRELALLLNQMLIQMEETFARLQRFTAHAGHELRTPLTRIQGEAELALTQGHPEAQREALGSILEEVTELRRTVDALLELARGKVELGATEAINLSALAQELAEEAGHLGRDRSIEVGIRTPERPVLVEGNRSLIARAIWNILDNAFKYAPPESNVEVEVGASAERAFIDVSDRGPGVPEELRERIFEPFFRVPRAGPPGTGLGLALALSIAHRHRGQLGVVNREGCGAQFRLSLPRSQGSGALAHGQCEGALKPPS